MFSGRSLEAGVALVCRVDDWGCVDNHTKGRELWVGHALAQLLLASTMKRHMVQIYVAMVFFLGRRHCHPPVNKGGRAAALLVPLCPTRRSAAISRP
jgi:hypothetical protein